MNAAKLQFNKEVAEKMRPFIQDLGAAIGDLELAREHLIEFFDFAGKAKRLPQELGDQQLADFDAAVHEIVEIYAGCTIPLLHHFDETFLPKPKKSWGDVTKGKRASK